MSIFFGPGVLGERNTNDDDYGLPSDYDSDFVPGSEPQSESESVSSEEDEEEQAHGGGASAANRAAVQPPLPSLDYPWPGHPAQPWWPNGWPDKNTFLDLFRPDQYIELADPTVMDDRTPENMLHFLNYTIFNTVFKELLRARANSENAGPGANCSPEPTKLALSLCSPAPRSLLARCSASRFLRSLPQNPDDSKQAGGLYSRARNLKDVRLLRGVASVSGRRDNLHMSQLQLFCGPRSSRRSWKSARGARGRSRRWT